MTAPRFFAGDAVDPTTEVVSAADYDALAKGRATATELRLNGKSPLRRILDLRVSEYGYLSAMVALSSKSAPYKSLGYSSAKLTDCSLYIGKYGKPSLWLGSTAFDVSEVEAKQIRETYEPLGLCIEKADPAPAPAQAETPAVSP